MNLNRRKLTLQSKDMKFYPIPGFEEFYEISKSGMVRSLDRKIVINDGRTMVKKGRILSQFLDKKSGYFKVILYVNRKKYYRQVHRLVAQTFLINEYDFKIVGFKDGNKKNCHVSNLHWVL